MAEEKDMCELLDDFYDKFGSLSSLDTLNTFAQALGYRKSFYGCPIDDMLSDCPGLGEYILDFFDKHASDDTRNKFEKFLAEHDK